MRVSGEGGFLDSKHSLRLVLAFMVVITAIIGIYVNSIAMGKYYSSPVAGLNNAVPALNGAHLITRRPPPTPVPTTAAPPTISPEALAAVKRHRWATTVWNALNKAASLPPNDSSIVSNMVIPLFHDGQELDGLLESIDAPVRHFAFAWNSDSGEVSKRMAILRELPFGVSIAHHPDNVGFSGAVNRGIYNSEKLTRQLQRDVKDDWYFVVNADAVFPSGHLERFAREVNKVKHEVGLVYGPRQDHFAFVITRKAVEAVGYLDEVFFPGYMEDIDYHWRVRIAGLSQLITRIHFDHRGSMNLKKGLGEYEAMLTRSSRGWEYGWMKWGKYNAGHIEHDNPPSGWKTPFNIPNAPLSLWAIDPGQRACVRTGRGHYHIRSSTCWYNGTVLLEHLPTGTELSNNLVTPGPSGG